MLIRPVNSLNFTIPKRVSNVIGNVFSLNKTKNSLSADIVSFSSKNYDSESIVNPTNHCAYCGSKIYDEDQLDSIAKEILSSKSERLEGKIKSILEKLTGAKQAPELALAKETENKEHIKYFNDILTASQNRPYARGEELLRDMASSDDEDCFKTLRQHMQPLLATVDHVSPQRKEQDNNNIDSNLVEACYCCNHDIKDGMDFNEFYTLFPSIEHNMPKDKFIFASSSLLDKPEGGIERRLSAASLIKHLDILFAQKKEAENALSSVNYRIAECDKGIDSSIESIRTEISEKQNEITQLRERLEERKKEPEFQALLQRNELQQKIATEKSVIGGLRDKKNRTSNSLNDLQFEKQGKKSVLKTLTKEESEKVDDLKANLIYLDERIAEHTEKQTEYEIELETLDSEYPPVEIWQYRKRKADAVVNAYESLDTEYRILDNARKNYEQTEAEEHDLIEKTENAPVKSFDDENYSEDEIKVFQEYLNILDALDTLEKQKNGNAVKSKINASAKIQLTAEKSELEKSGIVRDFELYKAYNEDKKELKRVRDRKADISHQISSSEKQISRLKKNVEQMTKEDAQKESEFCAEKIRYLNDLRIDLDIPSRIDSLIAGINLLEDTIQNLLDKQRQIKSAFSSPFNVQA